jgi:hypothetical protein
LMINHCDAFDGPTNPFLARRQNCEAILQKLRSASRSPARSISAPDQTPARPARHRAGRPAG